MSVTRFFPWPAVGAWLDQRVYHLSPFARFEWHVPPTIAQSALLLELALNGYALRSVRDTVTARIARNQPRPDRKGEP